ncbi:biotin transporter BioY [Thermodesulfobacteriota bacterium]
MRDEKASVRGMVYASMFGAGTAVGAYIIIPIPPVPITLQTFFLYLAAALLGGRLASLSQFVYLLLGIIGLPVFSGGKAGLGVLFGPTGGYLIGFIVGAFIIGKMIEIRERPGLLWIMISMAAGTTVVYLLGVIQLSFVAKLTVIKSLSVGVIPFLMGDLLKIIIASAVTLKVRDRIKMFSVSRDRSKNSKVDGDQV